MCTSKAKEAGDGCSRSDSNSHGSNESSSCGRSGMQWSSNCENIWNSSSGDDCSDRHVRVGGRSSYSRASITSRGDGSRKYNLEERQVTGRRKYRRSRSSLEDSSGEIAESNGGSSGDRQSSPDEVARLSGRCGAAHQPWSSGACSSCSPVTAAACISPEEGRRLQKVVDKPVLNGLALLSIEEFLSLSSGASATSLSSYSLLADLSLPDSHHSPVYADPPGSSGESSFSPAICSSSAALPSPGASSAPVLTGLCSSEPSAAASLGAAVAAAAAASDSSASGAGAPSSAHAAVAAAVDVCFSAATSAAAASADAAPPGASAVPNSVAAACTVIPSAAASASSSYSPATREAGRYVPVGAGVVRDAFLLDGVFSEEECAWLRNKTEENAGYTYWDTTGTASAAYRTAFTVEMRHPRLAAVIWDRVKKHVVQTLRIEEEDRARAERDLLGEWTACGINPNLLFARYTNGGHFSPHTDGCTAMDFNTRTFWPALLYLNAVTALLWYTCGLLRFAEYLQTEARPLYLTTHRNLHLWLRMMREESEQEKSVSKAELAFLQLHFFPAAIPAMDFRHTAQPQWIIEAVKPLPGRMLFFYYTQMHESRSVGPGAIKYIIRTDVLYTRKLPLLTAPADKEAFILWQKAQVLAEEGMTEEAASLFRRSVKMSPALAEVYGM